MPDIDKLVGMYSDWPKGKLLEEYARKNDYSWEAVEAMEKVLTQIGLMDTIKSGGLNVLIEKEKKEAELAEQAWIEDRDIRILDADKLHPNSKGIYADAVILNRTKERLGNKGRIVFFQENESVKMSLTYGSLEIHLNEPFTCRFFASKTIKRVNFFKTSEFYTLYIQVKLENGNWITLTEEQLQFKQLPAGWNLLSYEDHRLDTRYVFEYSNYEVRLTDLAKLL